MIELPVVFDKDLGFVALVMFSFRNTRKVP